MLIKGITLKCLKNIPPEQGIKRLAGGALANNATLLLTNQQAPLRARGIPDGHLSPVHQESLPLVLDENSPPSI